MYLCLLCRHIHIHLYICIYIYQFMASFICWEWMKMMTHPSVKQIQMLPGRHGPSFRHSSRRCHCYLAGPGPVSLGNNCQLKNKDLMAWKKNKDVSDIPCLYQIAQQRPFEDIWNVCGEKSCLRVAKAKWSWVMFRRSNWKADWMTRPVEVEFQKPEEDRVKFGSKSDLFWGGEPSTLHSPQFWASVGFAGSIPCPHY